jgi:hypothetical protein
MKRPGRPPRSSGAVSVAAPTQKKPAPSRRPNGTNRPIGCDSIGPPKSSAQANAQRRTQASQRRRPKQRSGQPHASRLSRGSSDDRCHGTPVGCASLGPNPEAPRNGARRAFAVSKLVVRPSHPVSDASKIPERSDIRRHRSHACASDPTCPAQPEDCHADLFSSTPVRSP